MKKVLIITYYWPPMGGGGVQRWLKMSKYLDEFGWVPVIYTPSNADVANFDESLLKEVPSHVKVVKTKIWEPFDLYKKFMGKSKHEKIQPGFLQENQTKKWFQMVSVWIRGNVFIPDAKKHWIKPSIKYLVKLVKEEGIDAVISTGPPHSNHLIALGLKKKTGIKWLADFRDPWTNIDYYHKLMLSKWADQKHKKLEKQVFEMADEVVTVSWSWAKDFEKLTGRIPQVITNGYDPADFSVDVVKVHNPFISFTHIGSLNQDRNPHALWKAFSKLKENHPDDFALVKIRFIGPTDVSVFTDLNEHHLDASSEYIKHLDHQAVIDEIQQSDILLLPLNDTPNIDGVIPGKLYEYLASKRPILCIGKLSGDAAKIIEETKAGSTFDFTDVDGLYQYLKVVIERFKKNQLNVHALPPEKYSRRYLAGKIGERLDLMT